MKKFAFSMILGLLWMISGAANAFGQQAGYKQSNLVANVSGVAAKTDSQLSNPWGISFVPGNPFWIANNNGGTSTLYDAQGNKQSLVVGIPSASVSPCNPGCPTGNVANTSTDFNGGFFIFDTEDGIIANWTGANSAVVAFDNSAAGAVYKGLALINNGSGNFLLAANFRSGQIDVFDRNFKQTALSGSFSDPNLPAGFAPHGVHVINGQVYVTYAMQDSAKHDPTPGAGTGVVNIFDLNGNFVKRFASAGTLNAPWGVVATPASFGTFSSDIFVGNFGDGTINAFDSTGKFLGQVKDTSGNVITNPGLWDMVFGAGGTGDPNTLYFTAGGPNQTSGLFATLVPETAATNPDFSLSLSAKSATLMAGGSASFSVSASPSGGFNSSVSLSCTVPTGLTCAFSPASITPGSSTAKSTLTVTAAATAPPSGYIQGMTVGWLPVSGLGAIGMMFAGRRQKRTTNRSKISLWIGGILVLGLLTFFTLGCGGGSSSTKNNPSTVTMMVTGTSGSISHSTPVTLTIQ